jgi:N-acetylglutamate synthase-like GNAT family acetyltransferase
MEATIRYANVQDVSKLKNFLTAAKLGTEGISEESAQYFLLVEDEKRDVKGTLGIEPFGNTGLLRSLVVTPGMAEKEVLALFNQMLLLAKNKEINTLFLATNKQGAVSFFETLGFEKMNGDDLPAELKKSSHIQYVMNVDNSLFLKFSF